MPFRVRVRNFQSIKDAAIRVSGLTVITGPNNSGKTAMLRAVRGAFTNAPAGPLVRKGEAHLTVDLSFEDGRTLTWEKGNEKPDGKGKAINRYVLDGKALEGVGRGVPPEVEALGVREISAGTDGLWPQIARQFDGTLFLVDRPGSVVAEALSDVERVGKLSDALRASESDRRTISSEMKVRRADLTRLQERVQKFDGLDPVLDSISTVDLGKLKSMAREIAALKDLASRLRKSREDLAPIAGFTPKSIPDSRSLAVSDDLRTVAALAARLKNARRDSHTYNLQVSVPLFSFSLSGLEALRRRASQKKDLQKIAQDLDLPPLPSGDRIAKYPAAVAKIRDWSVRYGSSVSDVGRLSAALESSRDQHAQAVQEAHDALHSMGECPTCGHAT
jgi:exonuclease SbcC